MRRRVRARDKPSYEKVLQAARAASCEIIELAPTAGKMSEDNRPGVVQLKFVDVDVGAVLAPFATPQTVILDANWAQKFNRRGAFDDKALAENLSVLTAIASAPAMSNDM